jgi:hypothetical protein
MAFETIEQLVERLQNDPEKDQIALELQGKRK